MTTQQQSIIDSLIAEFNKINNPIPNGFARIGEALDKCDEWNCLVAAVKACNAKFEYLREDLIETDFFRLKEECRLAGIDSVRITMGDDYIALDVDGDWISTDNRITINYRFEKKMHLSDTNKSIDEFKSIQIYSYQASSTAATKFESIDSLFLNETFFRNWTKLIEHSRK
jgi:hypothetical protein